MMSRELAGDVSGFSGGAVEQSAVSVIVVSWNVCDLLRNCLNTIARERTALSLEVIVVDSDSDDGSQQMVEREFPWVRLIRCHENVGFPRGNNTGIAVSAGRYVLLLNPDTEVRDGAIERMFRFLEENHDVGAVGPQLLNADGSVQSSHRRFPTLATAIFESTWLEKWAPQGLLQRYYVKDAPEGVQVDVDWVTGACLMVRRLVVDGIGPMDEQYFMYSEELDWCRRIRDAGWRIVYLPTAQVTHYSGKSSEQAVTARHINFQRAKLRYFRKFHGRPAATFLRGFLLLSYAWQMILEAGKWILGHRRELRSRRVRSYWRVLASGLRPAGYP